MRYTVHPSPLGDLLIAGPRPGAVASVSVPGQRGGATVAADWRRDDTGFTAVREQFDAYFAGELTEFDLELALSGTDFRRRVWDALDLIGYGETVSYKRVAELAGLSPRSVRAVGGAVGANPLMVVRPCHRVVGADGSLTGYAGGLDRKVALLRLEGALTDQAAADRARAQPN